MKKITIKTTAKPRLISNKLMLCVWWDWKGIIHYELLPPGKTINSDLYCQQLMRLRHNATSRPYLATHQILREFGWEVLIHPPYRPDQIPDQIITCFRLCRIL
ncbi:Mariner Mos1 transposase [Eumeta japonica]|uniref:Mariner Mos1 transposase n=1 Tax=Eumeta variegata TaxID=151549 RepID=A0A4C1Y8R0_EUMVA|nr:Mariner Mos1 transposase [Eumeta japonica]